MQPRRPLSLMHALVALSIVALVAACGPGASAAPSSGPTATAASVASSGPTAAPATDIPPDQVTGELTVFDWSGYEVEGFWQDFKDKYANVDVSFPSMGGSDADIYNGIKTGTNTSDVFHPYTGWLQFYVDEGLVAEIDTTKLANWDSVPDKFKELGQFNGKQYFIPWDWGFTSVLHRTDKIPTVDSWSVLLDPQYDGHIMMWDDGPGAVTVSSYIHGWDETAITDAQLAEAKAEWTRALKENPTLWLYETELVDGFENGDVWAGYAWPGAYATLLVNGNVPVAYAHPEEGWNSWVGMYGINAASENYDLALRFLDEKLGPVNGDYLVATYYYGHANADVMAGITDENLIEAFSVDDPTVLDRTNFTPNLTAEQRDAWIAMWSEAKVDAGN